MADVSPGDALRRVADLLDDHPGVHLCQVQVFADELGPVAEHRLVEACREAGPAEPCEARGTTWLTVELGRGKLTVFAERAAVFAEPARDHGLVSA